MEYELNDQNYHLYINKYGFDMLCKSIIIQPYWFQSLTTLCIRNNHIGNKGVEFIAIYKPKFLKYLYLGNNDIDKDGAKIIADELICKSLTDLHLDANNIGDEGVKYITESLYVNKSLTRLYLGSNNIGNKGAEYIANMLKINKFLRFIDLGGNNISNVCAITESLRFNKCLDTLYLNGNNIDNMEIILINELLKINKINKEKLKKEYEELKIYILIFLLLKSWQFEFLEFLNKI